MQSRARIRRGSLREDAVAGVVLGVQSVPDGLAIGLLAGVNPIAGLNAYLVGTMVGALATSSVFMAIQGTGAMAMIVSDVEAVHSSADPARALFTLSVLTGVVMLGAGLLKLGSILQFVSHSVMVGFINAIGVNIVLGQLADFTGYDAQGANRIARAIDTLLHPGAISPSDLRDRRRHDRTDRRSRADQAQSTGPHRRGRRHVRDPARARLGRRRHAERHRRHPKLAATARATGPRAGSGPPGTGSLSRVRRSCARREHLGQLPQP